MKKTFILSLLAVAIGAATLPASAQNIAIVNG